MNQKINHSINWLKEDEQKSVLLLVKAHDFPIMSSPFSIWGGGVEYHMSLSKKDQFLPAISCHFGGSNWK